MNQNAVAAFVILSASWLCYGAREGMTESASYDEFRYQYKRDGKTQDKVDYLTRRALFESRVTAVQEQNAKPDKNWEAAINEFADFTDEEFHAMLGYITSSNRNTQSGRVSSFLETQPRKALAQTVDWRAAASKSHSFQRNQGACGSCWAVAAVGALEMHAELKNGHTQQLSFEQLVDCVPNPHNCGGEGGCRGATAELAYAYVKEAGLDSADSYKTGYMTTGKSGKCKAPAKQSTTMDAFEQLPINNLRKLQETLAEHGPVVVSVDAGGWSSYSKGIFDGCPQDAVVNHAVLMVGYGSDDKLKKKDYFMIRNSWGGRWGEEGYIRLQRHSSDEGDAGYCGTDHEPKKGVGCDGGPATLPVCGMCGVLSDSVVPKNVRIAPVETSK